MLSEFLLYEKSRSHLFFTMDFYRSKIFFENVVFFVEDNIERPIGSNNGRLIVNPARYKHRLCGQDGDAAVLRDRAARSYPAAIYDSGQTQTVGEYSFERLKLVEQRAPCRRGPLVPKHSILARPLGPSDR